MFDIRNAAILFIKLVIATQKQINDLISGRKKTVNFIQFTVQNMKFSIKDLFSKCDQIRSGMENFIFCAVIIVGSVSRFQLR